MNIGFILGYSTSMTSMLEQVLENLSSKYGFGFKILTRYSISSDSVRELFRSSKVILIYSPELEFEIEDLMEKLASEYKPIIIGLGESHYRLSNVNLNVLEKAYKMIKYGGKSNLEKLVKLMLREAGFEVEGDLEPTETPVHGVYHPRLGFYERVEDYLRDYESSSKPLVGILFYRSDWLYGNTGVVDELVNSLEKLGLGVIPVFTYGFRDDSVGFSGACESIRRFFILDGKPLIEALVNLTSFSVSHGDSSVLVELGVPVIQAVVEYYMTPGEWVESERGASYSTIVYRISMPEVEGAIEPLIVGCSVLDESGGRRSVALREQVELLAKRVYKWVVLRRKKPWERRVAIILINPPCKSLEANVAVGFGLDVPESVVRFLRRLERLGYNVGDWIPESGEELVKTIMERRAISEFRWTSVEDVVSRGGALGFVDLETYMKWFMELPEKAREEIRREWGDPRDVVEGRVDKALVGMVYNKSFVIPGLRFGNIVVLPQPKRGCAGSRCDGRVCKILHNPRIPPPHQWVAVYRWLTRVFKADLIIHFGTHGYLEFLPGKSLCLSTSCWPLISVDDAPHLYVYVVSNPMEGVLAKRRGYAAIVDHMYPPMRFSSEKLGRLDDLLEQYQKAVRMNDNARAEVLYREILEEASKLNIRVDENASREEVVEFIHRYCDMIRNTLVNRGLHVLGEPPEDIDVLAEYVATILSCDTPEHPSLRRVIAEYLGLDYDELRRNPGGFNSKYSCTNHRLLELIDKASVEVLKFILKNNLSRENDLLYAFKNIVSKVVKSAEA